MKRIMLVLLLCSFSHGLQAPYLINATALSDSSVQLTWRNNDAAAVGFIVQRKDSAGADFKTVDSVKSAATATYTDIKNLQQQTMYTYQMLAYNATDVSIPSNTQQTTTLELKPVFTKPVCSAVWYYDTSKAIGCWITDYSNCEKGFRIYRAEGLSTVYTLIANILSTNPKATKTTVIYYDTTVSTNKWYTYKVLEYSSTDSLFSDSSFVYTYRAPVINDFIRFTKVSNFPVNSPTLSAKAGDSIILKEILAPAGKYTIINIADPKNPKFDGYIDSSALLSYPVSSLLPAYFRFNIINTYASPKVLLAKDKLLVLTNNSVKMYLIQNNDMILKDSIKTDNTLFSGLNRNVFKTRIMMLNDSLMGSWQAADLDLPPGTEHIFFSSYLTSNGFATPSMPIGLGESWSTGPGGTQVSTIPYVQGIYGNKIFISVDVTSHTYPSYSNLSHKLTFEDFSTNICQTSYGSIPLADAYNTGYYLSPTINLCTNSFDLSLDTAGTKPFELFASDVRDPYSHSSDLANNAVFHDSTHKQNDLQNILIDKQNGYVYLIFKNTLTVLSYPSVVVKAVNFTKKDELSWKGIVAVKTISQYDVAIVLKNHINPTDLFFYDLAGRLLDKMPDVTSNAVLWRPKTLTKGCYFVVMKSKKERFVERFMVR